LRHLAVASSEVQRCKPLRVLLPNADWTLINMLLETLEVSKARAGMYALLAELNSGFVRCYISGELPSWRPTPRVLCMSIVSYMRRGRLLRDLQFPCAWPAEYRLHSFLIRSVLTASHGRNVHGSSFGQATSGCDAYFFDTAAAQIMLQFKPISHGFNHTMVVCRGDPVSRTWWPRRFTEATRSISQPVNFYQVKSTEPSVMVEQAPLSVECAFCSTRLPTMKLCTRCRCIYYVWAPLHSAATCHFLDVLPSRLCCCEQQQPVNCFEP
jgi:hypothetical protein